MDRDFDRVRDFGGALRACLGGNDMKGAAALMRDTFGRDLTPEQALALEAEALRVAEGVSSLSYAGLEFLASGFGWRDAACEMARLEPESHGRMMRRLGAASLYEGAAWQAGVSTDPGIAAVESLKTPSPRLRQAARVVIGRGAPEGGVKRIAWTPGIYRKWTARIEGLAPVSFEYFDRLRIDWLKRHVDILEELELARGCAIAGAALIMATHLMMWFYNDVLPDEMVVPGFAAWAGIVAVFPGFYLLLSRYLPR